MPIAAVCPSCGGKVRVPEELAGRKVKCPQCKGTLTVTVAVEPSSPSSPPAESRRVRPETAVTRRPARPAPPADRENQDQEDWENDIAKPGSDLIGPGIRYTAPSTGSRVAAGLGLASLLVGVLSLPLALLGQVGQLGLFISGFGLFLGLTAMVFALFRRGHGLAFSISGLAVCSLGLGLAVVQLMGIWLVMKGTNEEALAKGLTQQLGNLDLQALAGGESKSTVTAGEKAATPTPQQQPWHDASKGPLTLGDVRIQVGWVVVSQVKYQDLLEQAQSTEKHLGIQLRIDNIGTTRKIDYKGWAAGLLGWATLTDNLGNSYKRTNFGLGTQIVGQVQEPTSIYPGKSIEDLLVFEAPLENALYLGLELPAATLGGSGKIQIRIPKAMIRR